jgi:hypothetical protein
VPTTAFTFTNNHKHEDLKQFEIASQFDAATDKLRKLSVVDDKEVDVASDEAFSLLTRCVLAHEYLKQLKPKWLTDGAQTSDEDDEEFMSYYTKYYEHFYQQNTTKIVTDKYNLKRKKPVSVFETEILVHNTSNTSLFPIFIFLRAKWRKYWKEPKEKD